MAKTVIKELMEVYACTHYDDGNKRAVNLGKMYNITMSSEREQLLEDLFYLIKESDIVSEPTKVYMFSSIKSIPEIAVEYSRRHSLDVDERYIYNKIQYDSRKVSKIMSIEDLKNVIYNPSMNIDGIRLKLTNCIRSYFGTDSDDYKLGIELNSNFILRGYDGDFLSKYGEVLRTYSKVTMKKVEDELNEDLKFLGYFNYLTSGLEITDEKCKSDRDKLMRLLRGDEQKEVIIPTVNESSSTKNVVETKEDIVNGNIDIRVPRKTRVQF